MKLAILLLFSLFTVFINAQNKMPTLEEAEKFITAAGSLETYHFFDYEEEYEKFSQKKIGEISIEGHRIFKVLEFKEAMSANYRFIFLDTDNLTSTEINTLRETIISKYKFGIPFSQLSEQYSYDKSPDSDFEITTNSFGQKFQAIADSHYEGDIFTIDPPILHKYAVVLKNTATTLKKFIIVGHILYE